MKRLLVDVKTDKKIGCWKKGKAFYCKNCKEKKCIPDNSKIIYCHNVELFHSH